MPILRRTMLHSFGMAAVGAALRGTDFLKAPAQALLATREQPIHLDRNESPYGPSEKTAMAMRDALLTAHRYPDLGKALREKLAALHKVQPEQVMLGCGSSELLRMAADTFLAPRKKLVTSVPTFPLLEFYARQLGAEVKALPLTREYAHDLRAMLAQCDRTTGLIYICNPNNPTGTLTVREDLESFVAKVPNQVPVIMDEAYHHYVRQPAPYYASFLDRPVADRPVIVLRTFSKIYGLAGLRVGYAVGPADLMQKMSVRWLQFSVNTVALKAALAAVDDASYIDGIALKTASERQEFINRAILRKLRFIDSHTNFVMLKTNAPAEHLIARFKEKNISIGPAAMTYEQYVRVTMGLPEEMQDFWRVIDSMPGLSMAH